tara:strand:- start:839 stop:1051 length:213 start_codon:yes stop_codon:yes gene_type:complete
MSELVDIYDLDDRLVKAITQVANNELISQDEILKVLRDCYAYLSWTTVQDAMKEVREIQKMTQRLLKEMD